MFRSSSLRWGLENFYVSKYILRRKSERLMPPNTNRLITGILRNWASLIVEISFTHLLIIHFIQAFFF